MVERFFNQLTNNRLRRHIFHYVIEAIKTTNAQIAVHDAGPKLFIPPEEAKRGSSKFYGIQSDRLST